MTQHSETRARPNNRRPRLAVFKFASCDGCQLQLLSCEDELLKIGSMFEIVHFAEASSRIESGPYDIAVVEGSISTASDIERIRAVRESSDVLITIGACATTGGIQALRNGGKHSEFLRVVYARPDYIDSLETSTPISDHVRVDFELRGCPIDKNQLLAVLSSVISGHQIQLPQHSVCMDCKRAGHVCVMVASGSPCLGPVTHAGCGALCPSYSRGCYGCFGPVAQANAESAVEAMQRQGVSKEQIIPLLQHVNTNADLFREAQTHCLKLATERDGDS